jgi:hypothetical protein
MVKVRVLGDSSRLVVWGRAARWYLLVAEGGDPDATSAPEPAVLERVQWWRRLRVFGK